MTMDNSSVLTSVAGSISLQVEEVLQYLPQNPCQQTFMESWIWMTDNFTKFQIATFGSMLVHEALYILICLPSFLFQFIPFMRRFKIQDDKTEVFDLQWQCLKWILFNHFCVQPLFLPGIYIYMETFGVPFGWEEMPRWYDIAVRMLICLVIEDTWNYWMHRIMHDPRLYKYVHKVHHHFQAPFGMTAECTHPIETLVIGPGFFLGIILACNHMVHLWVWLAVRIIEGVDVHSGYDIPYINVMHLIPGYAGARFHDFHHYNFVGNYASTFRWWDWLCGTDAQYMAFIEAKKRDGAKKTD